MSVVCLQPVPPARFPACSECPSRYRSVWCSLPAEDLDDFTRRRVSHRFGAGDTIFRQGQACHGLFSIRQGLVGIRKLDATGHAVLVRLLEPGQSLGYRTYFSGGCYSASAVALTDSVICFAGRDTVNSLMKRNPALALRFLARMADDLRRAEDHYLESMYQPVRERFIRLLITLKNCCHAERTGGAWHFRLPLSRQDLATALGVRPETLSRAIRCLDKEGLARFNDRVVVLPDLPRLEAECAAVDPSAPDPVPLPSRAAPADPLWSPV